MTIDGPALQVRGIPAGEIVSLTPREAAMLAATGELPAASTRAAFDTLLADTVAGARLAAAIRACDDAVDRILTEGGDSAADLARTFLTLTVGTAHWDDLINATTEAAEAASWIATLRANTVDQAVDTSLRLRGRVPGFGHPRMVGLDPRFVAIHAVAMRTLANDETIRAMHTAAIEAPARIAARTHQHDPTRLLPNLYLPLGVGLAATGLAPAVHAARLADAARETCDAAEAVAAAIAHGGPMTSAPGRGKNHGHDG